MSENLDTKTWLFIRKMFSLQGLTLTEINIQLRETELQESLGHGLQSVKCFNKLAISMVLTFPSSSLEDIMEAQEICLGVIKTAFVHIELKSIKTNKPNLTEQTTITVNFGMYGDSLNRFEQIVKNPVGG